MGEPDTPVRVRDEEPPHETWPIEIHPGHDCHVWLTEDFRNGTFGHPWEPRLCVFGEELRAAFAEIGDETLGQILRRNGCPARVIDTDPES